MSLSLNTLDVSDRREKGLELHKVIVSEVKRTVKSNLFLPIPNLLLLTQTQWDDLSSLTGVDNMYYSEDRFYTTPYNIMEVRIDKRNKLTFQEAHSLDDKNFDEWERSIGATDG